MRGSTSAPTRRVLDIVELLARPGNERLRFSDVARELGLTQGTSHAILTTLCDRGWLARDPDTKTFALGPVLAAVATRAEAARPLVTAARAIARELCVATGFAASVVERTGDALVVSGFEAGSGEAAPASGDRVPYAPPFGVAFAAWDNADERGAWMRRAGITGGALADNLDKALDRTRQRGFDVDRTTPALARTAHLIGTVARDGIPAQVSEIMDRLVAECAAVGLLSDDDPGVRALPIVSIAAPLFGPKNDVALLVSLHPGAALGDSEIDELGGRLVTALGSARN